LTRKIKTVYKAGLRLAWQLFVGRVYIFWWLYNGLVIDITYFRFIHLNGGVEGGIFIKNGAQKDAAFIYS